MHLFSRQRSCATFETVVGIFYSLCTKLKKELYFSDRTFLTILKNNFISKFLLKILCLNMINDESFILDFELIFCKIYNLYSCRIILSILQNFQYLKKYEYVRDWTFKAQSGVLFQEYLKAENSDFF